MSVAFPDLFSTPRLRAERLRPEHFGEIHRMHQDARHMALLGGIRDEAGTASYMERNLRHWAEYHFGVWLLRDSSDGQVAGRAVLRHLEIEGRDEVEVGYGFHPQYWGRGLAQEIAAACLEHAREALRLDSVIALTHPAHTRSQHVLTSIGMSYEREIEQEGERLAVFRTNPGWAAGS
jgi:RimJ/RimL family protein N-acetyltransferase